MPAITSVKSGTHEVLTYAKTDRASSESARCMTSRIVCSLPRATPAARSTPRCEKPIRFPSRGIGGEEEDYSRPAAERGRLTAAESTLLPVVRERPSAAPVSSAVRASSAAPIIPAASPSCVVRMRASGR